MTDRDNNKAQPEKLPAPTYWPMLLALSIVFMAWGLLTEWVITLVGVIGIFICLAGWINEMRYENRENRPDRS